MSETENERQDAPAEGEGNPSEEPNREPSGAPSDQEQFNTPGDAEDAPKRQVDDDLGQAQVQAAMDEVTEKGYVGAQVDPTPNENYSTQTPPDTPTPETDRELAVAARVASHGDRLTNVETPSHLTAPHNSDEESQ